MGMLEYKNIGGDVGGGGKFKIFRRSDWKCHCGHSCAWSE